MSVPSRALFRACFRHLYDIERRRIAPTPESHLRLHRLERPQPWERDLLDAIEQAARWDKVQQYPDYGMFHARAARFFDVPESNIVVGAGIEGLIRDLMMLCCDPGDPVVYTWPTCAMFDVYAKAFSARSLRITASPELVPVGSDIAEVVRHNKPRLVILPNPGQPVDIVYSDRDVTRIARQCAAVGAVFAIDEAYNGFGAQTAIGLVQKFDNVVVLRTMSKAFGAASIRVGFAIGNERVIQPLNAVRASGEISGPSLRAAMALMDNDDLVKAGAFAVRAGRDWLRERLTKDGWLARGSYANHVLVDMNSADRAHGVATALADAGIHVRRNAPPLGRYLMVTCGDTELMQRFYAEFKKVA